MLFYLLMTEFVYYPSPGSHQSKESSSRCQSSRYYSPEFPSKNPCRLESRLSTVLCRLDEVSESWSSVTGRPERPPSPWTRSSTRNGSTTDRTKRPSFTASTSPSVKRGRRSPRLSSVWPTLTPWNTPSLSALPHPMLLLCSIWRHIPGAPWENSSETTGDMLWSSMTTCPNR